MKTEVRKGGAAGQILAAADQLRTDLIVLATHGRTGLTRWLLGSIADEVVRQTASPVFLPSARARVEHATNEAGLVSFRAGAA